MSAVRPGEIRRIATLVAMVVAAFVMVAAWDAGRPTSLRAAVADTVRVRADNPPVWGPNIRLVRELEIDGLDGPGNASGKIGYVASTSSGAFFIYDSQDTVIRRYDAAGKFLGKFGRGGGGPGEFRWLFGMEVVGDSMLVAYDPRASRISLFGLDGTLRRTFPTTGAGGTYGDDVFLTSPDGLVGIRRLVLSGPGDHHPSRWTWFRLDGTRADSTTVPADVRTARQFWSGNRASFGEGTIVRQSPTRDVITAWNSPYRFAVTRGTRTTIIERSYTPVPIHPDERKEWIAAATRMSDASRAEQRNAPAYVIPERKPALREIRADRFGRIWVEVYVAATKVPPAPGTTPRFTWLEPTVYDVFEPAGRYLGRIELPMQARLSDVQRDRLWLLSKGPDGEDVVSVYRIPGAR